MWKVLVVMSLTVLYNLLEPSNGTVTEAKQIVMDEGPVRPRNEWNLLDFTDTFKNMYGVLDCCSHKADGALDCCSHKADGVGSLSVPGAFYDYIHAPRSKHPRLSVHMSFDLCLGESEPSETSLLHVARTVSLCTITNPSKRLMITDHSYRQGAFETFLLQILSLSTNQTLYGMEVELPPSSPLMQFYTSSTAYRYTINSTKYCFPRTSRTKVLYSPVFVRESLRGTNLKCEPNRTVCDDWFGSGGYRGRIKWPFGVAETPNFNIADLLCRYVPSQTVNSIIHMYPVLSFRAMVNIGRSRDVHFVKNMLHCQVPRNSRHTGLCFYGDIYNNLHKMDPSILSSSSPGFRCLRSFYDGNTSHAYPKCVGDLPPMHKTFGAYKLTLKPNRANVWDGGGFYTERQTRGTASCLMAVPVQSTMEDAKLQVAKYTAYCDTITLAVSNLTYLQATVRALDIFASVASSLGVMLSDTLLEEGPKLFSDIKRKLANPAVLTHFTINLVSDPNMCLVSYLGQRHVSRTAQMIKTMNPGTVVTVRAPGSMFYNLPKIAEFSVDFTDRELDGYVAGIDFIILVMARLRTNIPFRDYGQAEMKLIPQCPSQWVPKTRSHWLWSSESVVGPYVQEPELAHGVRPNLYGVVAVPNAIAMFGPDKVVVELDTGCTYVRRKDFSTNYVAKCNKTTSQTAPCSPLLGSDCCAVEQLDGGFTFMQSTPQLQHLVSELMTWGVRHLHYGFLDDVDLMDRNGVLMLDLLHSAITPKPVMFLYSTDRSGPPEYCPGVVKATKLFFFQRTDFHYTGFFRTPIPGLAVGPTDDKSLCRRRVVDAVQPHVTMTQTYPGAVDEAYYLDTLSPVRVGTGTWTRMFRSFLFYENGTVFLYNPPLKTVIDTYTVDHMSRTIPAGRFTHNPMALPKVMDTELGTYVTTRVRPKLVGQTPVSYKYTLTAKVLDMRTKYRNDTTVPGVNTVMSASRRAEFLGTWTAGNSLFGKMGLSYPKYNETNYGMSGSHLMLDWEHDPIEVYDEGDDDLTVHMTSSLSFLDSIGRTENYRRTHDNLYACLLGSGLGCWTMTEETMAHTVLGPGRPASWNRSDTWFKLTVRNHQNAKWVINFDYAVPLVSKSNGRCFSTEPILAAIYSHTIKTSVSDDPLSTSADYMCGNCVKNVCVLGTGWIVRIPFVEEHVKSVKAMRLQRDICLEETRNYIDGYRTDPLNDTYVSMNHFHAINATSLTLYINSLANSRLIVNGGVSDILNITLTEATNQMYTNLYVLVLDALALVLAIALAIGLCLLITQWDSI